MIYKGKEYAEVTDNSGAIGDLVHVTEVERVGCDIWGFTTDSDFMTPDINVILPNGWETLDGYNDEWTRYRYVKDAEENETGLEEIWIIVADIYNDENGILQEQVKTSEEEAHRFVWDMGNTTLVEDRSTEKIAVYEQEVDDTIKEVHIALAYRYRLPEHRIEQIKKDFKEYIENDHQ